MDLSAKIKDIKYRPLLCRKLSTYKIDDLEKALNKDASFFLESIKGAAQGGYSVEPVALAEQRLDAALLPVYENNGVFDGQPGHFEGDDGL